jgi:uncharacterized membrane protein
MDGRSMMSGGSWVLPAMLLAVVLVLAVLLGYLLVRSRLASARPSGPTADHLLDQAGEGEDSAEGILRARYVRGEIEIDEYEQRLEALLHAPSTPGQT